MSVLLQVTSPPFPLTHDFPIPSCSAIKICSSLLLKHSSQGPIYAKVLYPECKILARLTSMSTDNLTLIPFPVFSAPPRPMSSLWTNDTRPIFPLHFWSALPRPMSLLWTNENRPIFPLHLCSHYITYCQWPGLWTSSLYGGILFLSTLEGDCIWKTDL